MNTGKLSKQSRKLSQPKLRSTTSTRRSQSRSRSTHPWNLGTVLFQEDRAVAFASKALTETESRYANIERDMLAVIFGCECFHNFLFGQDFIVESDHKPLESIHLKHLSSVPAHLRRMLLRLQPYTLVIKYKLGREVAVADALSRLPVEDTDAIPNLEA